jgi:hypothetical protein
MNLRQRLRLLLEALVLDVPALWWAAGVPLVVFYAIAFLPLLRPMSERLVLTASLLQIFGLAQVALGLHSLRLELGRPPLLRVLHASLIKIRSAFSRSKGQSMVIAVGAASLGALSATGRVSVVDPNSLESRVKALEEQMRYLEKDLQTRVDEIQRRVDGVEREARDATSKLRTSINDQRQLLENVHIGGLSLEAAGLFWLLVGQVIATWPDEIAPLASRLVP